MRRLADGLGVDRAVELLESALVQVPTVVGWLRPVILLPASALTGLSIDQLEALLAHELAHIRRCDYLVNMLQTVIETLGFYHPAVWWVSHKIRIERENCCDDLAVSICGDRVRYARALTSMEEIRSGRTEFAIAASGGNLFARIHRLLGKDSTDSGWTSWIPSALTILLMGIIAIPTTLALTAQDKTKPSAKFLLDRMLEHRCRVRNLQYVAENVIWRDENVVADLIKGLENQLKRRREEGAPEREIRFAERSIDQLKARQESSEGPQTSYELLKCTIDNEGRSKIERTRGTHDSSGTFLPDDYKHIRAWNGVQTIDFYQEKTGSLRATIKDIPSILDHPWGTFTGYFCQCLEETIEAKRGVSVEKLEDKTFRVAFDYKIKDYPVRRIVTIIDPSRGYTCTLLENYYEGQLSSRETATYKEVAEGIWFPVSGQLETFFSNSTNHRRSFTSSDIRINDPAFNAAYFDVDIPEGTEVTDEVHNKQYVVGSKRAYDLDEQQRASAQSQASDPNAWKEKFYSLYRLEEGQVLKRIAPPFIPERTDYFRSVQPGRYSANTPSNVVNQYFNWDGALSIRGARVGGIPRLESILESVIGLGNREYDLPPEVLSADMSGDWIVRKDSPQEELLQALEQIIKDETGRDIDFVRQNVETEVIIAKGKYIFQPLPNITDGKYVLISSNKTDTYTGGGGGSGTLAKFLRWVGNRVEMNIVDETEAEGIELSWRNHDSSDLSRLKHDTEPYNQRLELLLNNLTRQTGLTFERETAIVEKWFVNGKGNTNTPQKTAAAEDVAYSARADIPAPSGPAVAESREAEVFGRVLQDGRNVAGARVIARVRSDQPSKLSSRPPELVMRTGENGLYRFVDLPAGRYSISVMSQKGNLNMAQKQINLEPGGRTELNFGDEEGFTLTGVVTANGEAVEIASVMIQLPNESVKWGWTDRDGNFRITGVPSGRHQLFTTYDKDLDPVTFLWGKDGKQVYDTLFDRRQITIENDRSVDIRLEGRSKKEDPAVTRKPAAATARIVKVELSVVEVSSDSKMDGKTIGEIKNLLGSKIVLPDSPAAGDLLRQASQAMEAGKDESAADKRVTQEQFNKLFDLLVSRGYLKILLRPTVEVVEGQTAQLRTDQNSLEVLVHKVKDDAIDLQVQADLSSPVAPDGNDQTPMFSRRSFSSRVRISPDQSIVVGGTMQPGLRTAPASNAESPQTPAKELLCILTAKITTPPADTKPQVQAPVEDEYEVVQLRYIAADEAAQRVTKVLSQLPDKKFWPSVPILPLEGGRQVIIFGNPDGREKVKGLLAEMDVFAPTPNEVQPKRQVTISGRCLDSGGQPLSKAQIQVFCRDSAQDSVTQVAKGTTDSEGRFSLGPIASPSEEDWGHKSYFVLVPADGHGPAWKGVNLYKENIEPLELRAYNSATVTGSVVTEDSMPAVGVQVWVRGIIPGQATDGPQSGVNRFSTHVPLPGWSATTDSDGSFRIAGIPDATRIQLFVSHRDFAGSIVHVKAGAHAKIELQPGAAITGRVLYGKTGKPAAGVVVGAQGVEHISIPAGWMATGGLAVTDEQGRYRLESLPGGKYNVYPEAEDLTVVALDSFEVKPGEVREAPDLVLIEGGFIAGRVIDEATGKPVMPGQHSNVSIYGPSRPMSGAAIESSLIHEDGTFRIRVAPGRNYIYLQPTHDWGRGKEWISSRSPWVDVADGQTVEVEFRVRKISQEELDKEAAFWQRLRSHVPQTSDELEDSANRLKQLGLAIAMYAKEHDGTLPDGLQQLEGYVRDQEQWRWLLENVEYLGKGKTGQPNAARVPIAYDRTLLQQDYSDYSTEVLFLDFSVRFVGPPELRDLGITRAQRPTQPKPDAVITGWVVNGKTGKPAAGVVVQAMEAEPGSTENPWVQTITDEQGRYRLESMEDAKYGIWVETENLTAVALDSFQATAGQTREAPDLVLVEGGFIVGRVIEEATGQPVKPGQYSDVAVRGPSRPRNGPQEAFPIREDGSFRIRVAPGRNSVALQPRQDRSGAKEYASLRSVSVTVDEGETAEVELRVRKLSKEEMSAERLMGIGRAMLACAKDHDGKYPARAKLHELQQYLKTKEYAWPRQYEYLADGKTTRDRPDIVIYYDAELFEQGKGTNVLFNDGHVEFVGPKRLNELNINKTQILIETRILEVTDDFLKENRLDANSVHTGGIRSAYHIAESAAEPNSLPYCLIFDDTDVDLLLKAMGTPQGKDAKVLAAPRVLTLDGRPVTMKIVTEELPVPRASDPNDPSGKAESKPQYVEVGTSIKITPDALPDSNNVLLDCEWELSQVVDFAQRIGPGGKKQRIPVIDRFIMRTHTVVPEGRTLLIGGKKIHGVVVTRTKRPLLGDLPLIGSLFRSESKVEDTRNVLILIKPTIDPKKKAEARAASGPEPRPLDSL